MCSIITIYGSVGNSFTSFMSAKSPRVDTRQNLHYICILKYTCVREVFVCKDKFPCGTKLACGMEYSFMKFRRRC